jgi:hypothetical protein
MSVSHSVLLAPGTWGHHIDGVTSLGTLLHPQQLTQTLAHSVCSVNAECILILFFLWDEGLNSGLCACKAGTLLLQPHIQCLNAF